jgi:hypothetical protein
MPALMDGTDLQDGNLDVNHKFEGANLQVAVSPRKGYYKLLLRNESTSRSAA